MGKRKVSYHDMSLPSIAFDTAEVFASHAIRFIHTIPTDNKKLLGSLMQNIAPLSAAATELTLAVELYFKALHGAVSRGKRTPQVHELVTLYTELPPKVQASLVESFDRRWRQEDEGKEDETATIVLHIGESQKSSRLSGGGPLTLMQVLEINNTAFLSWRYMHELPTSGGSTVEFTFRQLVVLVNCLREEFRNQMAGTWEESAPMR